MARGFTTKADYEAAQHQVAQAREQLRLAEARQSEAAAKLATGAQVPGVLPAVAAARAQREAAELNLTRTDVRAPIAGRVTQADRLHAGQQVVSGLPVATIVTTASSYIEANFKETELADMAIGQPAEITFDAYPGIRLKGHVQSIGAGTGSEFSVLPAQSRQAQMMGVWGMGIMLGPILGPLLGGWLTENWNWRWVFYVNVPLGAIALTILITELPSRAIRIRRFDMFGFAMVAVFIAAMQMMLDRGTQEDWFASGEIWFYALLMACCGWIGAVHLATSRKDALFNRALFADRNLVVALIFMAAIGVAMFATMALLPPMLQQLFGYTVIDTGWVLMPRGVGTLLSMQIAGQLSRRGVDPRSMVFMGFVLTTLSFWQMSGWSLGIDERSVITSGFIQGLGMGLVFIPLNNAAFATLPQELRTEGSSLLILLRSLAHRSAYR